MLSKYSWALSLNVRAPGGENSSCKGPKEATYLSLLKKAKEGLGLDQGAKGL